MPSAGEPRRLIRRDFYWDVKVIHGSSSSAKDQVLCTVTFNTVDDFGNVSKVLFEMSAEELDVCIAALKRKL